MTEFPKKTLDDWQALATKERKGRPVEELTWDTPEGIAVKPLYTAEDLEGLEHLDSLPGMAPFVRGPKATMYAGRPWTVRQYAGFSTAEESNAFYRKNLAGGPDRPVGGLRSGHPSRLRLRSPARGGRCGQGGRGHRQRRGHEDPVRRHSAGQDVGLDDHERRGVAGHGHVHRRRRRAGCGAGETGRDPAERHPEGVHGPQHLYLSARTIHADRVRHHRLHLRQHAQVQFHLHFRLSHAGSRRDLRAGTGLHHRRRHRVRARRDRQRSRRGCLCAAAVVLFRHRHELLHGGGQAARGAPAVVHADGGEVRAAKTPAR